MDTHYGTMLFAQSLMMLVEKWDEGLLKDFPRALLANQIRIALFGLLVDILQIQNHDGSWGTQHSYESTAYEVVALTTLSSFPLSHHLEDQLRKSISRARQFLQSQIQDRTEPDPIFRAKSILSDAYIVSAMSLPFQSRTFREDVAALCMIEEPGLKRIKQISALPFFSEMPDWLVRAITIEGYLYLPIFNQMRTLIFPRRDIKQHRQWNVLPFCAIACSRSKDGFYAPKANIDFMVFGSLLYEVDHYMEAVITSFKGIELDDIRQIVYELLDNAEDQKTQDCGKKSLDSKKKISATLRIQDLAEVKSTLQGITSYTLNHPKVTSASKYDQAVLRKELKNYFLAQITSNSESSTLAVQRQTAKAKRPIQVTQQTYHSWLHNTSATHVGGLVIFAFMACLNNCNDSSLDSFPGAAAKYYAQDLSLHFASYTRITNDIGSVERDRQENNLNSIDFAEFGAESDNIETKTQELQRLAEYEKEAYSIALERLKELSLDERKVRGIRALCNMGELYAEIYAMEDITPRLAR